MRWAQTRSHLSGVTPGTNSTRNGSVMVGLRVGERSGEAGRGARRGPCVASRLVHADGGHGGTWATP